MSSAGYILEIGGRDGTNRPGQGFVIEFVPRVEATTVKFAYRANGVYHNDNRTFLPGNGAVYVESSGLDPYTSYSATFYAYAYRDGKLFGTSSKTITLTPQKEKPEPEPVPIPPPAPPPTPNPTVYSPYISSFEFNEVVKTGDEPAKNIFGKDLEFIQGRTINCKISASVTNSYITKYEVAVINASGEKTIHSSTTNNVEINTYDLGVKDMAGEDISVEIKVYASNGRTTTSKKSNAFKVYHYFNPRPAGFARWSDPSDERSKIRLIMSAGLAVLGKSKEYTNNILQYAISIVLSGESPSNNSSFTKIMGNKIFDEIVFETQNTYDISKAYDVYVYLKDRVGDTVSYNIGTVTPAGLSIDLSPTGLGVAMYYDDRHPASLQVASGGIYTTGEIVARSMKVGDFNVVTEETLTRLVEDILRSKNIN